MLFLSFGQGLLLFYKCLFQKWPHNDVREKRNPVKSLSGKSLTKLTISWNEYTEQYHKAN